MAMDHAVIFAFALAMTAYAGVPDQNFRQSLHHAQEYATHAQIDAHQQYEGHTSVLQQEYHGNEVAQYQHVAEEALKTDHSHLNQQIQFVMVPRDKYAEALQEYLQHNHLQIQVQEHKLEEPKHQLVHSNLPVHDNTQEYIQEPHQHSDVHAPQVALHQQPLQLVPYEYASQHKHVNLNEHHNQEPWRPILHPEGVNDLVNVEPQIEKGVQEIAHTQQHLQYAPEYKTVNVPELHRIVEGIKLANIQAHATADAIARSPPVVVHKDINITRRRPINIIKAVTLPVPSPVLVPFAKPYEVKVPQPYAVPFEIIRPVAFPVIKTEKTEVEKPVPVEVEKHVHVPVEKKVFYKVDRPVPVEKKVPFEIKKEIPVHIPVYKPQKFTIVRHVWGH